MFCSFGSPNPCNQGQVTDFFAKNARHTIVVSFFLQTNANKIHFFAVLVHQTQVIKAIFVFFQKMQLNWLFLQNFQKNAVFFCRFGSPNPCNQSQVTDFFCKKCKQLQKIAKQMQLGDPLTDLFFVFFELFFLIFLMFSYYLCFSHLDKNKKNKKTWKIRKNKIPQMRKKENNKKK